MEKKKSKKKYWKYLVTIAIFALMVLAYYLISSSEASNSYLFPAGSKIWQAFVQDKSVFGTNALHSFKLLIPSLFLAIVLSLAIGIPLGLNETARDIMYPVLYVVSVVPAILLSPFGTNIPFSISVPDCIRLYVPDSICDDYRYPDN